MKPTAYDPERYLRIWDQVYSAAFERIFDRELERNSSRPTHIPGRLIGLEPPPYAIPNGDQKTRACTFVEWVSYSATLCAEAAVIGLRSKAVNEAPELMEDKGRMMTT